MTTKIKTGIKLKVNPEQSEKIQNICFANDIYWSGSEKKLYFPEEAVYYINIRQEYMTWNEFDSKFSPTELEEIDTMLFIRTNGTCVEEENQNKVKTGIVIGCLPEQSEKIQRICFDNDIEWRHSGKEIQKHTTLYIKDDKTIVYIADNEHLYLSIDPELFIRTEGTCILDDVKEQKVHKNAKELMEGLEPPKEEPEQPKQYLVYVEGKQAPKKVHNSLKSAQKEANRLAKREIGYVTYVVEIVNKYIGSVSVEEIK